MINDCTKIRLNLLNNVGSGVQYQDHKGTLCLYILLRRTIRAQISFITRVV